MLGPSLKLVIRNAKARIEGMKNTLFPFTRQFYPFSADAPLTSVSVHRLFVHNSNRIEIAALRYFQAPVNQNDEAQKISELSAFVEQAAESLQLCTAKLPLKAEETKGK